MRTVTAPSLVSPPPVRRFPVTSLTAIVVGASLAVAAVSVAITIVVAGRPPETSGQVPTGALKVVEVENIRAEVPVEWRLLSRSGDTLAVEDRTSRAMWLRSANVASPITLDEIQDRFLDKATGQSPDAKICAGPDTAAVPGGPRNGRYFAICSTFIPQGGGRAVVLADAYYAGVDSTGITVMVMQLTSVQEVLEAFARDVRELPPPVWKLYRE